MAKILETTQNPNQSSAGTGYGHFEKSGNGPEKVLTEDNAGNVDHVTRYPVGNVLEFCIYPRLFAEVKIGTGRSLRTEKIGPVSEPNGTLFPGRITN